MAMPRGTSSAQHLVNYIRQDKLWDADMDRAPGWPACVWETKVKPVSGQVSRLMLENPDSIIAFQPFGHLLIVQILAEEARVANQTEGGHDVDRPASDGESLRAASLLWIPSCASASEVEGSLRHIYFR